MNTILHLFIIFSVLFVGALAMLGAVLLDGGLRGHHRRGYRCTLRGRMVAAANAAILSFQSHKSISRVLDNAVATRYLLAKSGVTAGATADICGAADEPIGVFTDEGAAGDYKNIQLAGIGDETAAGWSSGAIAADAAVYAAANGQIQADPTTVAGTYWRVGRSLTATTGANQLLEYTPSRPVKVIVITATGAAAVADIVTLLKLATGHAEVKFI
jgi:hypothetical protein